MEYSKAAHVTEERADGESPIDHGSGSANGIPEEPVRVQVVVNRDLSVEVTQVLQVIRSRNNPSILFSNADSSAAVEIFEGEIRALTRERAGVLMAEACEFGTPLKSGTWKSAYPPGRLIGGVADALPSTTTTSCLVG